MLSNFSTVGFVIKTAAGSSQPLLTSPSDDMRVNNNRPWQLQTSLWNICNIMKPNISPGSLVLLYKQVTQTSYITNLDLCMEACLNLCGDTSTAQVSQERFLHDSHDYLAQKSVLYAVMSAECVCSKVRDGTKLQTRAHDPSKLSKDDLFVLSWQFYLHICFCCICDCTLPRYLTLVFNLVTPQSCCTCVKRRRRCSTPSCWRIHRWKAWWKLWVLVLLTPCF